MKLLIIISLIFGISTMSTLNASCNGKNGQKEESVPNSYGIVAGSETSTSYKIVKPLWLMGHCDWTNSKKNCVTSDGSKPGKLYLVNKRTGSQTFLDDGFWDVTIATITDCNDPGGGND